MNEKLSVRSINIQTLKESLYSILKRLACFSWAGIQENVSKCARGIQVRTWWFTGILSWELDQDDARSKVIILMCKVLSYSRSQGPLFTGWRERCSLWWGPRHVYLSGVCGAWWAVHRTDSTFALDAAASPVSPVLVLHCIARNSYTNCSFKILYVLILKIRSLFMCLYVCTCALDLKARGQHWHSCLISLLLW